MTYVCFENSAAPIVEADFDWLAQQLGVQFPLSARSQYLEFNGGEPDPYVFASEGSKFVVQQFFSIKYGKAGNTIEDNYAELVMREGIIPRDLIPFAIDPAGDYYCVSAETGGISIFRSEHLPDISRCLTHLADSMTDFVAGLSEDVA